MIFVFDNDDKSLEVFPNESVAIVVCEGIDVEESPCEFWNNDGGALRAVFTKPNNKGLFTVISGNYHLEPNPEGESLLEKLSQVSYVEGNSSLKSVEAVRQHLTSSSSEPSVI